MRERIDRLLEWLGLDFGESGEELPALVKGGYCERQHRALEVVERRLREEIDRSAQVCLHASNRIERDAITLHRGAAALWAQCPWPPGTLGITRCPFKEHRTAWLSTKLEP